MATQADLEPIRDPILACGSELGFTIRDNDPVVLSSSNREQEARSNDMLSQLGDTICGNGASYTVSGTEDKKRDETSER